MTFARTWIGIVCTALLALGPAAWAQAVRTQGGIPLYSTSWDNRASRAVAHNLGLSLYGEDLHWR